MRGLHSVSLRFKVTRLCGLGIARDRSMRRARGARGVFLFGEDPVYKVYFLCQEVADLVQLSLLYARIDV